MSQPISAFVTSTITAVGLTEMAVTMNSTNPGKVGEPLVYNVTVTNIQDDDARNVFAILVLPKLTTFVSATKGCTHGALVTCKLGQMSPGTSNGDGYCAAHRFRVDSSHRRYPTHDARPRLYEQQRREQHLD